MMLQHQLLALTAAATFYLTFPSTSMAQGQVTLGTRSRQLRRQDCHLKETTTIAAGEVRNLIAKCRFNAYQEEYYYQFTWDPPHRSPMPVLRYRVSIWMGSRGHPYRCFQLGPKTLLFLFNRSVGFKPGREFRYGVIAQPIKRDENGSFHTVPFVAPACPMQVKLEPLQNVTVPYGANVTFECKFEDTPFPPAKISWYFSKNKITCEGWAEVKQGEGISLLKNMQVLQINNAQKRHVGCYVLTAENGVGDRQVEKGYLELNEK